MDHNLWIKSYGSSLVVVRSLKKECDTLYALKQLKLMQH